MLGQQCVPQAYQLLQLVMWRLVLAGLACTGGQRAQLYIAHCATVLQANWCTLTTC